jgi:hypothetical protein
MGLCCVVSAIAPADAMNPQSNFASGHSVELEKAWHGLHYLLTGTASEGHTLLGFLIEGGQPLGDDDGFGPPRLFYPAEVAQIHAALSAISDEQFWSRFDADVMTEKGIYPGVWDEPEDDLREEYVMYFLQLKELIALAARDKQALLVQLT